MLRAAVQLRTISTPVRSKGTCHFQTRFSRNTCSTLPDSKSRKISKEEQAQRGPRSGHGRLGHHNEWVMTRIQFGADTTVAVCAQRTVIIWLSAGVANGKSKSMVVANRSDAGEHFAATEKTPQMLSLVERWYPSDVCGWTFSC